MKFRTSCFNPTLARHHWKRSWPLPVVMLLWCLCYYVLSFLNQFSCWTDCTERDRLQYFCSQLSSDASTLPLLLSAGALVAALLVFRYLHSRSASQFYLTMPMKRRCSWLTGVLSGWVMAVVPMLVTIAILLCVTAGNGLPAAPVLRLLLYGLGTWTIFYALAVVSCILAGNVAGALLIYLGVNGALYCLSCCCGSIAAWYITGYGGSPILERAVLWLTPVAKLQECISYDSVPLGTTVPLVYLAAGILLLGLSGLLYQCRKSENAGETIAFGPVRLLCKVVGALLVSVLGTIFLESCLSLSDGISFAGIAGLILLFLCIGWFAAAMIIRRSFRVLDRKELTGLAAAALVLLLLLTAGKLDLTGYTAREPDLTQVTSAQLVCDSVTVELSPAEVLQLHETILQNRNELVSPSSCELYYTVELDYTRSGGNRFSRTYELPARYCRPDSTEYSDSDEDLPAGAIYDAIISLLSEPENNLQTWFSGWTAMPDPSRYQYADVCRNAVDPDYNGNLSVTLTDTQAQTVYEAFLTDLKAGKVQPACMSNAFQDAFLTLELEYKAKSFEESGCSSYDDYVLCIDEYYAYLPVTPSMTNTLAVLESCGISTSTAGTTEAAVG